MNSFTDRVVKFFRLPGRERLLLVQAWLLLLLADLALRLFKFSTVLRFFHPVCGAPATNPSCSVSTIVRLVETAGRFCPAGTSCLKEALVLSRLLAQRGIPATLRIGVADQAGSFAAHAWMEQDGQVVLGAGNVSAYTPLLSRHS